VCGPPGIWHEASSGSLYRDDVIFVPSSDWLKQDQSEDSSRSLPSNCDLFEEVAHRAGSSDGSDEDNASHCPSSDATLPSNGLLPSNAGRYLGIHDSFMMDPEFSFLHGLCMPFPSHSPLNKDQPEDTARQEPNTPSSSCRSSSSRRSVATSGSCAVPSRSSSFESGDDVMLGKHRVLPEIGETATRSPRIRKTLDNIEPELQQQLADKAQRSVDVRNVTSVPTQKSWDVNHCVLPAIGQSGSLQRREKSAGLESKSKELQGVVSPARSLPNHYPSYHLEPSDVFVARASDFEVQVATNTLCAWSEVCGCCSSEVENDFKIL